MEGATSPLLGDQQRPLILWKWSCMRSWVAYYGCWENKFGCPLRSASILNCLYSSKHLSPNTKNVFAHWILWMSLLKACWHALVGLFLSPALPFLLMPLPHGFDYCTFIDNILFTLCIASFYKITFTTYGSLFCYLHLVLICQLLILWIQLEFLSEL